MTAFANAGYELAEIFPRDIMDGRGPVALPCPAGSALFLDRFTPHRTIPTSGDDRFALVVWFNTASQHGVDDGGCPA